MCYKILLDVSEDKELIQERLIRELLRQIQYARKKNKYHVSEKIDLKIISKSEIIKQAINSYRNQVMNKVNALNLEVKDLDYKELKTYDKSDFKFDKDTIEIYFKKIP
jgi:hypothetical protein